jgi:molybdopterin molybdotransferase
MISPAEAAAAIRSHAALLPTAAVPLERLVGTVLRSPVVATRDQPPFDRVTMDGIAFAFDAYERGRRSFRIAGTQAAGAKPTTLTDPDACLEVMTGAVLPPGCDCVVPVEQTSVRDGVAHLASDTVPTRTQNVRACGIDVKSGTRLLEAGTRLGPAEVAVIASNGQTHAEVARPPRIMVISTGDELVEPGRPVEPWQIHRSNAYAVIAALQRRGYTSVGQDHLPDDPATLRSRLAAHLEAHDVLILSGGVSMGRYDYVPQVLGELGVSTVFHRVSQRPGKPFWFGVGPGPRTVYALPGNPVSTLMCLMRYVLPGIAVAEGADPAPQETVPLGEEFAAKVPLTLFVPVKLASDGSRTAHLRPTRGSGDFVSLVGTDGFVELPPAPGNVTRGTSVPLYCW